jgi:hypothetical protein
MAGLPVSESDEVGASFGRLKIYMGSLGGTVSARIDVEAQDCPVREDELPCASRRGLGGGVGRLQAVPMLRQAGSIVPSGFHCLMKRCRRGWLPHRRCAPGAGLLVVDARSDVLDVIAAVEACG